jgi:hypothetical protein
VDRFSRKIAGAIAIVAADGHDGAGGIIRLVRSDVGQHDTADDANGRGNRHHQECENPLRLGMTGIAARHEAALRFNDDLPPTNRLHPFRRGRVASQPEDHIPPARLSPARA